MTAWLDKAGIKIRGYFMIGQLIDTEETIQETIDFAKSLPLYSMNPSVIYLAPGSEAREIAHEYGTVNVELDLGSGYPRGNLSFIPNRLTEEYIQAVQKKAISNLFFRPRQIGRLLSAIECLKMFEDTHGWSARSSSLLQTARSSVFAAGMCTTDTPGLKL